VRTQLPELSLGLGKEDRVCAILNFCTASMMQIFDVHCNPASVPPPQLHSHLMCTSYLVKGPPFRSCRPPVTIEHRQAARCSLHSTSQRACALLHSSCLQPSLSTERCSSERRTVLLAAPLLWLTWRASAAHAISGTEPATIRLDLAPDQSKYNAADERLRDAAARLQLALNAEDVKVSCRACAGQDCHACIPPI
jgi:hypothetical protein